MTNEKYEKKLDRLIILITIHNFNNLEEFFNFIKANKSKSLDYIKDETNQYIIQNLITLKKAMGLEKNTLLMKLKTKL